MILVNNKVVLGTNINASSNTTPFLYCNGSNEAFAFLYYASSSSSVLSPGAGGSGTATVLNMKLLLMITPGK